MKQGCAGAPGGGSPGTLERANVAGVRESVVAVASQLIEIVGAEKVVHVMRLGRLVKTLPGEGITYRQILEHALP